MLGAEVSRIIPGNWNPCTPIKPHRRLYWGICSEMLPLKVSKTLWIVCGDIPYTQNFSQHVYFTVKHGTRIFMVEILQMKIIQKFSCFSCLATWLYMKNLHYYFKRDRQSSLPNNIPQSRQSWTSPVESLENQYYRGPSKWARWHHHALVLKTMCRCMRWYVVHGQL